MKMYSILVHNRKTMNVIATLCIEADTAAKATRIGQEVVRLHQSMGILNAHAQVSPALDASQIRHLDAFDDAKPLDARQVRGRPTVLQAAKAGKVVAARQYAMRPATHWWPRLRNWWATRHQQFEPMDNEMIVSNWVQLR